MQLQPNQAKSTTPLSQLRYYDVLSCQMTVSLHTLALFSTKCLNRTSFSWNTLIRALTESEHDQSEAIGVFSNMLHCDYVRTNQYIYLMNFVLSCFV
jgi:hypothetical protein